MKNNVITYSIILLTLFVNTCNNATQLVTGSTDAGPGNTFNQKISTKVYDPASATLYVGLEAVDTKSIWAAKRPIGTAAPSFTPTVSILPITLLALVTNLGNPKPYLAYTEQPASADENPIRVHACTYDGNTDKESSNLKDTTGADTSNIVALAGMLQPDSTTQGFIFAAVAPTDTTQSFGDLDSGIAVVSLNNDPNSTTLSLNQTAAESAMPTTIAAKRLDPSTSQVYIGTDVLAIQDSAYMHWDEKLQRLYIGLRTIPDAGANNGAKSVVVAHVSVNGVLTLENILNETALTAGNPNAIVAAKNNLSPFSYIDTFKLKTMHCSTGPSYLIVNGDVGASENLNNVIYALPLVETCPADAIQGTIADKNQQLSYKHTFVIPATTNTGLPSALDPETQVGAGPLPIQPTTPISDIEVIGDTVFVSTVTAQTELDDNGIFYSQALFEKTGKITRWTPWTKRAFPFNGFCSSPCINNGVKFFAVDAVTGKVWAVDGATQKVVRVTAWDKGGTCSTRAPICGSSNSSCSSCNSCSQNCSNCQSPNTPIIPCCSLAAQLCASLPCGCYSVLDLDQATRGFTGDNALTQNRFALFGGCGKVDIAMVSHAFNTTITSPQTVTEDFCPSCTTNNFLETFLSDRNVCVNVLEYSRTTNTNQAYFFAGTDSGLYAYPITNFNTPTIAQGSWEKVTTPFTDPIIDIKTTGLSLYIITRAVKNGTMTSTLYRVDFQDTINQMFNDPNNIYILAQSGQGIFAQAPAFTGIQPVTITTVNNPPEIQAEQLLLATNNGLFGSNANPITGGISTAIDQNTAQWQRVPLSGNNKTWFEGIAGIDTPIPSTVWPISVEDLCGNMSFENSWIYQISSIAVNTAGDPFKTFEPAFFNAITRTPAFELMDPITYFWSDGARRFFIINRQQDEETYNKLMSFPFNTPQWRVCAPGQQVLIFDPYVTATQRFFWVKQIGITGILMAGTNNGVIALE